MKEKLNEGLYSLPALFVTKEKKFFLLTSERSPRERNIIIANTKL
jgi:hypothetical protein